MILIIKLILAHIIGDFILQPKKWVKAKEEKKEASWQLYAHVAIHGAVAFLLLADWAVLRLIGIIMISHYIIDLIKLKFQDKKTKTRAFILDQFAHIISITFLGIYWLDKELMLLDLLASTKFITMSTAVIFLSEPMAIIMNILIKPWSMDDKEQKNDSLKNAGKYIGILERLLVFVFIYTNNWEAVGFLLATKSVFRFGDLKESKEIKLTEYILIGTLLSFSSAILVALLTIFVLK